MFELIQILIHVFAIIIALAAMPVTTIGLLVICHVARPQRPGADASNRINKIRLIWFALTREDLFVPLFPWLRNDELKNVSND